MWPEMVLLMNLFDTPHWTEVIISKIWDPYENGQIWWTVRNGGSLYFRCFPSDHMLKSEELKPVIRVWIKHYKLTFRTISNCRHTPFSVDFFRFQTITADRIIETNWKSVHALTNIKMKLLDELDPLICFVMAVDLNNSWSS